MKIYLAAIGCGAKNVDVASLAEASAAWCSFRDAEGFGASALTRCSGNVYDGGKLIARVSYNGQVWTPNGERIAV